MRNLFGALGILFAVMALGVFRVPDENALVAAGIRAAAEDALLSQRHPLAVAVEGRVVTVTGRVESEDNRLHVQRRLAALEGVETVRNRLVVLPEVTPFVLGAVKTVEGVTVSGHVTGDALGEALGAALGLAPDLRIATGAPDAEWDDVALRAAGALAAMQTGRFTLSDRVLVLDGAVHLPETRAALLDGFSDLPEGYEAVLRIEAIDDGLPYALLVARDPLMGLRVSGKLPPDFDPSRLDALGPAQERSVSLAPLPLDHPGFAEVLDLILPLATALPEGSISLAPGVVAISGGPVPPALLREAETLALPQGWVKHVALVPEDSGAPLGISVDWDGGRLVFRGRVPADFDAAALMVALGVEGDLGALDSGLYPDLSGWGDGLLPALKGLILLESGRLSYGAEARIEGIAPNALVRREAGAVSGLAMDLVQLADDGTPPAFTLVYDATAGGRVEGKLPAGLDPRELATALGLPGLRGAPQVSPEGEGDTVLVALRAVEARIATVETLTLSYDAGAIALSIGTMRGGDAEGLHRTLASIVTALDIVEAPPAPSGSRRVHAALGLAQVFADGWWFPVLDIEPGPDGCAQAAAVSPGIPFPAGRFLPEPQAGPALAHLAAVARSCTGIAGLTLVIEAEAASAGIDVLNRQLARRRAEALRDALVARGVDPARIEARGLGQGPADRIFYLWQ